MKCDPLMPPPNPNRYRRCDQWQNGCPHSQIERCFHPKCLKRGLGWANKHIGYTYDQKIRAEGDKQTYASIKLAFIHGMSIWPDTHGQNFVPALVLTDAVSCEGRVGK